MPTIPTLRVNLSDLTSRADVNLENDISELLDDQLFEDLDILGPEVKDLVNTNPKIAGNTFRAEVITFNDTDAPTP